MASALTLPKEDLTCPVCYSVFEDPVILACSHSFCRACLQASWRPRVPKKCPVCRSISATNDPPCNLALKNLCQGFLEEEERRARPGFLCRQHGEKRKLYCLEDQQPMCVVCQTSKRHKTHECCPVDEAAEDYKEELQKILKPLQQKLGVFIAIRDKCSKTGEYIKIQAQCTENRIKEETERFHKLLQEEENIKIAALKEEEAQKSQLIKDQIDGLSKDITTLEDKIKAIKEELKAEDIFFLDNYKTTVERAQCTLQDPELVSESLIDVSKHLGNLAFNIWEKMKELVSYSPVILDPNTAPPHLILSKDLTSVKIGTRRLALPDNPERMDRRLCVLGSKGFHAGTHSWDIEVGDENYWEIGVMTKHGQRNVRPHNECWMIWRLNGEYLAGAPTSEVPTSVKVIHKPQRIRIQLDWGRGELSFFDCDSNEHLHTFRHRFTDRLFPFISTDSAFHTVRVMPVDVSVKVGDHVVCQHLKNLAFNILEKMQGGGLLQSCDSSGPQSALTEYTHSLQEAATRNWPLELLTKWPQRNRLELDHYTTDKNNVF